MPAKIAAPPTARAIDVPPAASPSKPAAPKPAPVPARATEIAPPIAREIAPPIASPSPVPAAVTSPIAAAAAKKPPVPNATRANVGAAPSPIRAIASFPLNAPGDDSTGASIPPVSLSVRPDAATDATDDALLEDSGETFALDSDDLDEGSPAVPVALTSEVLRERAHAEVARRARPRWESTLMTTNDPIVVEKRKPYVAERRARFAKVVKVTLGACTALCAVALIASATGDGPSASAATEPTNAATLHRAPAVAVVDVEALAVAAPRTKAAKTRVAPASAARHVKRHVKRR